MAESTTIVKNPKLPAGQDYQLLRRAGLSYIQQLSSLLWTDYNVHDPGITLLELLAYAVTDLSYRASLDIADLLTPPANIAAEPSDQAFYPAGDILTVSPWTELDYRKLLIDLQGVRNAWLSCRHCPCDDLFIYANCQASRLQYEATDKPVIIRGLYDVLVEFEDNTADGDLNSGKIFYTFSYLTHPPDDTLATVTVEMRLPPFGSPKAEAAPAGLRDPSCEITQVQVLGITIAAGDALATLDANQLSDALAAPLYAKMKIAFHFLDPVTHTSKNGSWTLASVPLRLWFDRSDARDALRPEDLTEALSNASPDGIAAKYAAKLSSAQQVINQVRASLEAHRNLSEDYCRITAAGTQDVALCGDIDLAPDADIEQVLAQAYYEIGAYFSPEVKYYSLSELLGAGKTVDEIYNGPLLTGGFIDDDQLASTELKTELHVSDIIAILMQIPGVLAVRNLVLSPFDALGNRMAPQSWTLTVPAGCRPVLYLEASKLLVYKSGLPLLPDPAELSDTLRVIEGQHMQPQYTAGENTLTFPAGQHYALEDYYPLQYSLPQTYGVGKEGLSPDSPVARKAQAAQLKAYLMFFEQLLVNYLGQLSHLRTLFSTSLSVDRTYFSRLLSESDIGGLEDIYVQGAGKLDAGRLEQLLETPEGFGDRRNRFLDHLMARFEEQFTDYTLMLLRYSDDREASRSALIADKCAFLKDIPVMGRDRARSFDYTDAAHVADAQNIAGLKRRISRVLGLRELENYLRVEAQTDASGDPAGWLWQLGDAGHRYLQGAASFPAATMAEAEATASAQVKNLYAYITDSARFIKVEQEGAWEVRLTDAANQVLATTGQMFASEAGADSAIQAIIDFAKRVFSQDTLYVVEHLLLRPRNRPSAALPAGDPLLSICISPDCGCCGEKDPYSYRLTIVMNGELGLTASHIAFRRFAERTIRMETPAHLALKICWVSSAQLKTFGALYRAWLTALATEAPDSKELSDKLSALLDEFSHLKSVYPPATLHQCAEGNDENRTHLDQTVI